MKTPLCFILVSLVAVHAARLNGRVLLETTPCDPNSPNANTCYNAPGTAFICCPGQCPNSPGPMPACSQETSNATPPPHSNNENVTQTGGISLAKPSSVPALSYFEIASKDSTVVENGDLNSTGTYIFYRNKVLDPNSREQIGFTTQFARQDVGPNLVPIGSFEQDTLYHLQIGSSSIIADGLFSQKPYATLAIVGGTGDYSFVQGVIVVDRLGFDGAGNSLFKGAVYLA